MDAVLSCSKWLATHACINSVEDLEFFDVCYATNGNRISEVKNFVISLGERWPLRKTLSVGIACLREADPVAGHLGYGNDSVQNGPFGYQIPSAALQKAAN
jgi:hypothetical protein